MGWGQPSAWSPTRSGIRGRCPAPRAPHRHGGLSGGLLAAQLRECPPRPCRGPAHFFSTFFLHVLSSFCFLQTCLSGAPLVSFLSSSRSRSTSAAVLDSWCHGSGDRGGGVGRGPAPLAPPLREPGHRGWLRVQGASRPLSASQLGAPPGCVARLFPGRARDSLCNWQGPGPAVTTFLSFWQSVRPSVCPCRLAQSVLLCLSRSHL